MYSGPIFTFWGNHCPDFYEDNFPAFLLLKTFFILYLNIVDQWCCVSFRCTAKWVILIHVLILIQIPCFLSLFFFYNCWPLCVSGALHPSGIFSDILLLPIYQSCGSCFIGVRDALSVCFQYSPDTFYFAQVCQCHFLLLVIKETQLVQSVTKRLLIEKYQEYTIFTLDILYLYFSLFCFFCPYP